MKHTPDNPYIPGISPEYALTAQILEAFTTGEVEDLLGFERGTHGVTGKRRVLDANDALAVATYAETDRRHMAEVIAGYIDEDTDLPLGHVEFNRIRGRASIDGALYVTETGVIGTMEIKHDTLNPISPDAAECRRFANELGAENVWIDSLFAFGSNRELATQMVKFHLNDYQQAQLNAKLGSY